MLSGRRFGELKKAVQGNTNAINEVRAAVQGNTNAINEVRVAVQGNTDAINEVRVAVQGNTDAINDMRNDMRNDIKMLTAATTRVAEAVEGMASKVDRLVDEIRRGNGGRSGGA